MAEPTLKERMDAMKAKRAATAGAQQAPPPLPQQGMVEPPRQAVQQPPRQAAVREPPSEAVEDDTRVIPQEDVTAAKRAGMQPTPPQQSLPPSRQEAQLPAQGDAPVVARDVSALREQAQSAPAPRNAATQPDLERLRQAAEESAAPQNMIAGADTAAPAASSSKTRMENPYLPEIANVAAVGAGILLAAVDTITQSQVMASAATGLSNAVAIGVCGAALAASGVWSVISIVRRSRARREFEPILAELSGPAGQSPAGGQGQVDVKSG